ncbi:Lrp/AsnC family transcriptional regulator [Brevibacterium casei]|uniref:AsnC family transcriptional regulator n=1 Tax=Brevibacterium casei S18 TaxID=1229781 RepID=K9ANE2_9MICO|nr:Lrp/AsnC family transcriptional regulator [Brevibacterium casei]EKU48824.1 AsnC family transcriptional regulator [Brevibacterium casei S18]
MEQLDSLDLTLVAALQHAPRAPLTVLADVMETSASTVSRRLSRLLDDQLMRITSSVNWSLRGTGHPTVLWIDTRPELTRSVAAALADLPEAQSVYIVTGDSTIRCLLHPPADGTVAGFVLDVIPQIPGVERISSNGILASSARSADWMVPGVLDADQVALLAEARAPGGAETPPQLRPTELGVVDLLVGNGRATAVQIAEELGITRVTAARALESVLGSGLVRPRIDIEPRHLGYPVEVFAQISCAPSAIADLVVELGKHPNVRTAAMTAGSVAVAVQANVASETALYEFVTADLGGIDGITDVRLSTNLVTVKRNWNAVLPDGRLVPSSELPPLAGDRASEG